MSFSSNSPTAPKSDINEDMTTPEALSPKDSVQRLLDSLPTQEELEAITWLKPETKLALESLPQCLSADHVVEYQTTQRLAPSFEDDGYGDTKKTYQTFTTVEIQFPLTWPSSDGASLNPQSLAFSLEGTLAKLQSILSTAKPQNTYMKESVHAFDAPLRQTMPARIQALETIRNLLRRDLAVTDNFPDHKVKMTALLQQLNSVLEMTAVPGFIIDAARPKMNERQRQEDSLKLALRKLKPLELHTDLWSLLSDLEDMLRVHSELSVDKLNRLVAKLEAMVQREEQGARFGLVEETERNENPFLVVRYLTPDGIVQTPDSFRNLSKRGNGQPVFYEVPSHAARVTVERKSVNHKIEYPQLIITLTASAPLNEQQLSALGTYLSKYEMPEGLGYSDPDFFQADLNSRILPKFKDYFSANLGEYQVKLENPSQTAEPILSAEKVQRGSYEVSSSNPINMKEVLQLAKAALPQQVEATQDTAVFDYDSIKRFDQLSNLIKLVDKAVEGKFMLAVEWGLEIDDDTRTNSAMNEDDIKKLVTEIRTFVETHSLTIMPSSPTTSEGSELSTAPAQRAQETRPQLNLGERQMTKADEFLSRYDHDWQILKKELEDAMEKSRIDIQNICVAILLTKGQEAHDYLLKIMKQKGKESIISDALLYLEKTIKNAAINQQRLGLVDESYITTLQVKIAEVKRMDTFLKVLESVYSDNVLNEYRTDAENFPKIKQELYTWLRTKFNAISSHLDAHGPTNEEIKGKIEEVILNLAGE